jgi:hypothetical protein
MMTRIATAWLVVVAAAGMGCRHSNDKVGTEQTELPIEPQYPTQSPDMTPTEPQYAAAGPATRGPTMRLVPNDMTTQVGASPLQVLVDNSGSAVGKTLLGAIAAKVRIVSWPEQVVLAANVTVTDATERRENGYQVFGPAVIAISPAAPLESRWYALVVDEIPTGVEAAPVALAAKFGKAGMAARFATGSDPKLARIRRCLNPAGGGKIVLDFSERIQAGSMSAIAIRMNSHCVVQVPSSDSGTSETVTAVCDALDRSMPVQLTLGNLRAASGAPMAAAAATAMVGAQSFSPWGECEVASLPGP